MLLEARPGEATSLKSSFRPASTSSRPASAVTVMSGSQPRRSEAMMAPVEMPTMWIGIGGGAQVERRYRSTASLSPSLRSLLFGNKKKKKQGRPTSPTPKKNKRNPKILGKERTNAQKGKEKNKKLKKQGLEA